MRGDLFAKAGMFAACLRSLRLSMGAGFFIP